MYLKVYYGASWVNTIQSKRTHNSCLDALIEKKLNDVIFLSYNAGYVIAINILYTHKPKS